MRPQLNVSRADQLGSDLPGAAQWALIQAFDDPRRKVRFDKALSAAFANGLGGIQAEMWAKQQTSIFNVLKPAAPRVNTLLSEDDWRLIQDTLLEVQRKARNAVADLTSRGLIRDGGDLGTMVTTWQKLSDLDPATVSMSTLTQAPYDRAEFTLDGVPIPVIHKDFRFELREIMASRNSNAPLDRTHTTLAAQLVIEGEEDMLLNGITGVNWGGYTLYGYRTHPGRITASAPGVWATDVNTTDNIYPTFRNIRKQLRINNRRGPIICYVNETDFDELNQIYNATGQSVMTRVRQLDGIEDIKANQFLPAGEMVAVEMAITSVDLVVLEEANTVQWDGPGGFSNHFKVLSAKAPEIKQDAANQVGVMHVTGLQ